MVWCSVLWCGAVLCSVALFYVVLVGGVSGAASVVSGFGVA